MRLYVGTDFGIESLGEIFGRHADAQTFNRFIALGSVVGHWSRGACGVHRIVACDRAE